MTRGNRLVTTLTLGAVLLVVTLLVPHANSAQSPDMTSQATRQPLSPAGDGGGLIGETLPISYTSDVDEVRPAVAAIPNGTHGQYLVACSSEATTTLEVVAQRVTSQGALEGGQIDVATGPGIKKGVDVAASESGGQYLVVWGLASALVQEQAVSPEGQLLGDMVEVYSPLTLAGEPLSDFFVAFQDASADGSSYDIYGHL